MSLDVPGLALVFSTGALALFSPCSFPMLPGYVLYYVGSKGSPKRALYAGAACTLGVLAVFTAIGLAASALRLLAPQHVPLLGLVAGIIVISMGVGMTVELKLPALFTIASAPRRRGLAGAFLYGVAYGLASSGCSIPIFLSIVLYAIAAGGPLGPLHGAIAFLVYALGMGTSLIAITVLAAKAKELALKRAAGAIPRLQRASGALLIAIGAYLIYYHLLLYAA